MKKRFFSMLCGASFVLWLSSPVMAEMLTAISVEGSADYTGDLSLLTDGVFPSEGTQWQTDTVYWYGTEESFTFDYGMTYEIDSFKASVDNNDNYIIEYSIDNSAWSTWMQISRTDGEVGWGMDTITNITSDEDYWLYSLEPVTARYMRISAIAGGDNAKSVGEFEAYGTSAAVPEPATMLLFGTGIACLAAVGRRRR